MVLRKSINPTDLWEIRDHRDNTAKEFVKGYTIAQLSYMDGIDTRSIRTSGKYIPLRVDTGLSLNGFKNGKQKRPYMTLWIRIDEIKYLYDKRNKKKKLIEELK